MKKIVVCLILGIFLAMSYIVPAQAAAEFTDIPSDHWAINYIEDLVDKDVINSYPDGSFKPEGAVTVEEFIKLAVSSLGFSNLKYDKNDRNKAILEEEVSEWARPYIQKAVSIDITNYGSGFEDFQKDISREEIAWIIGRCIEYNNEESGDVNKYARTIEDFNSIGQMYSKYVLNCYSKGIINGYPDGSFNPNGNASRAEACTMIYRMIHKDTRTPVDLPKGRMSVEDVIVKTDVYAEDPEEYHAYFYVREINAIDFPIDEFRSRIICTNLPEYNSYDAYAYDNPTTVLRDVWQKGANASFYINRVELGPKGKMPVIIEPGTKFEFIYTIEDLLTGESKDYPISLVTK